MCVSVVGCGQATSWTIAVMNDSAHAAHVRVTTREGQATWTVAGLATETILRRPTSQEGEISVVDPETCAVVATATFGPREGVLALLDRGANDDGAWQIVVMPDTPTQARPLSPVSDRCIGGAHVTFSDAD